MAIGHLRALVQRDFDAVNALIKDKIQSEVSLIDDLSHHIIESGGKRLRPLIVLLASHACQYQGQDHIKLAAMIEFFHTVTLLHDDVVDKSTLRRGKETANEIWGSQASILVGDYLFTLYVQLFLEVGDMRIMRLLNDIAHHISRGEIKQLANRHKTEPSHAEYFEVIGAKTALLFAGSSCLGALVGQSSPEIEKGLYDYGLFLGNAFQLVDDALDYCASPEVLGKNIGDDLADGKATLPLLYVLEQGTAAEKQLVRTALQSGNRELLPQILAAIQNTKAIEYTKATALNESNKAIAALDCLSPSPYKDALAELAIYAVQRDH